MTEQNGMKDIHIIRYFSSLITISNGRVIKITNPSITHCPFAGFLYKGLKRSGDLSPLRLKGRIKKVIEDKITQFGFCSKDRILWDDVGCVPCGASEIIAHGLKNKIIDSSVIVCDGAGTAVVPIPQVAQGIGARMHSVLKTTAIREVIAKLHQYGCHVISNDGTIEQEKGVIGAAREGYKKIAVTINGYKGESLKRIRVLESKYGISIIILAICTTGISKERVKEIEKYADMVWACHSEDIKRKLRKKAIKILSGVLPVYVLTEKGKKLISGYSPNIFGIRKEIETLRPCSGFHPSTLLRVSS